MVFPKQEIVDRIKAQYPPGTRVRLVRMDDEYCRIAAGTKGTVRCVDDTGTIHVNWDGGGSLGVVYGEDECEKLRTVKTVCYGKEDVFDSRDEAVSFYMKAMAGSEGSEQECYQNVLLELAEGRDICTDGVE